MSRNVTLGLVAVLLISVASVVLSIVAVSTRSNNAGPHSLPLQIIPPAPSQSKSIDAGLPHGFYVDGKTGTPHYFVSVVPTSATTIKGAVDYVYQDGQSDVTFTFSGTASDGVANLLVRRAGSASATKTGPSAIVMLYKGSTVQLGECPSFMKFVQSLSSCNFTAAATP